MADASAIGLFQEVLIEDAPTLNGVVVEVLAETPFQALPELRSTVVGRHSLVKAQQITPVNEFMVEVLADDQSFVPLPELRASVVGRSTLSRAPMRVPVMRYTVEVLAETELEPLPAARALGLHQDLLIEEIATPNVNQFTVEVLASSNGFEPEIQTFMVEVLAGDSTPVAAQNYVVEVLADSTDDVSLTQQSIIWFFNDH